MLSELSSLQLTDDQTSNDTCNFLDDFTSLFIEDDVISQQSVEKIKCENVFLHNKLKEITDYTLTLHKMIGLLKKQNSVLSRALDTQDLSSHLGQLSLNDEITSLYKEEQHLLELLQEKQLVLQAQVDNHNVTSHEMHLRNNIVNLSNEMSGMNSKIDIMSEENISLTELNDKLNSVIKVKEDEIQVMQNKLNVCSSIIEEQSNYSIPMMTANESQPWIVNPNEIEVTKQMLGTGAWGVVSLGIFRGLTVAVKQLHRLILSPHNQQKFLREMEISSKIRHPHILQFMCCSQVEQTLLVVTEVMDISAREAYLSNSISKQQSAKILLQCGLALQYLHGFNPNPIIHRDISSCNVLLSPKSHSDWTAKLSDFGAANFLRDELSSAPGAAIYAAPEAYSTVQNTMLDVFSFGVLMIELITHRLPDPSMRDKQLQTIPSKEIQEVIASALNRQPHNRPKISSVVSSIRVVFDLTSGISSNCA